MPGSCTEGAQGGLRGRVRAGLVWCWGGVFAKHRTESLFLFPTTHRPQAPQLFILHRSYFKQEN